MKRNTTKKDNVKITAMVFVSRNLTIQFKEILALVIKMAMKLMILYKTKTINIYRPFRNTLLFFTIATVSNLDR